MIIMTKERVILKAKEQFGGMIEMIRQAAAEGWMINEVESDIWKRLLKIGRLTLQGYVDLQGTGDLGATFEYEDQRLNRLDGCYRRRYVSVFGKAAENARKGLETTSTPIALAGSGRRVWPRPFLS